MSLPIYPTLTVEDQMGIINLIKSYYA